MTYTSRRGTEKKIKIFAVGGAGIAIMEQVDKSPNANAEYIAVHCCETILRQSSAPRKFLLGHAGLPINRPSRGRVLAEDALSDLRPMMKGAELVVILAGMGGAVASGASPVLAMAAREQGIIAIGVVTTPFGWETGVRKAVAGEAQELLAHQVDLLVSISNEAILDIFEHDDFTLGEAIWLANEAIGRALFAVSAGYAKARAAF